MFIQVQWWGEMGRWQVDGLRHILSSLLKAARRETKWRLENQRYHTCLNVDGWCLSSTNCMNENACKPFNVFKRSLNSWLVCNMQWPNKGWGFQPNNREQSNRVAACNVWDRCSLERASPCSPMLLLCNIRNGEFLDMTMTTKGEWLRED